MTRSSRICRKFMSAGPVRAGRKVNIAFLCRFEVCSDLPSAAICFLVGAGAFPRDKVVLCHTTGALTPRERIGTQLFSPVMLVHSGIKVLLG